MAAKVLFQREVQFPESEDIYEADGGAYHQEDQGMAQILELYDPKDEGMFVRLQDYSETREFPQFDQMRGKRIRVTVEILG